MVKYASNNFLATKISFINEMANLCEAYGADINRVREGMCSDKRIGTRSCIRARYGGSCFPKDTLACIMMGETRGLSSAFPRPSTTPTRSSATASSTRSRATSRPRAASRARRSASGASRSSRAPTTSARPRRSRSSGRRWVWRRRPRLRPGRQRERTPGTGLRPGHPRGHVRGGQGRRCPGHLHRLDEFKSPDFARLASVMRAKVILMAAICTGAARSRRRGSGTTRSGGRR